MQARHASPAHAKFHAMAAQDRQQAAMHAAIAWGAQNPAELEWLEAQASAGNQFARSLGDFLCEHGYLTERQVEAVRRNLTQAQAAAAPVEITIARIEAAFNHARESGLKRLRLNLDTFEFKPAKEGGRNAGGIYVTEGGAYLGKVMGGKFLRTRECSDDQERRIVAAASDPSAAAKAYGQRTGTCCVCKRELTAEESIDRFMGPICASRYAL